MCMQSLSSVVSRAERTFTKQLHKSIHALKHVKMGCYVRIKLMERFGERTQSYVKTMSHDLEIRRRRIDLCVSDAYIHSP